MTRNELKERLLKAGLPKEVVDAKLAATSDEDLVRMKDIPAAMVSDEESATDGDGDIVLDESVIRAFGSVVADVMKETDYGINEVEVEIPELQQLSADVVELKEAVAEIAAALKEISKTDEERLKELNEELSPSQRLRIRYSAKNPSGESEDSYKPSVVRTKDSATVVDGSGKTYESLSDMLFGGA